MYHCRRLYCATPFYFEENRDKHEQDKTPKHEESGICPVRQ